jgi:hypothetical protein
LALLREDDLPAWIVEKLVDDGDELVSMLAVQRPTAGVDG